MQLTPEELNEYKLEAFELIDVAEQSLLSLDRGGEFKAEYDAIFRAFHNLKGSAGMLEFTALQSHMHQMETIFVQHKDDGALTHELIDYFLKGCDRARGLFSPETKSAIEETAPHEPLVVEISKSAPPTPLTSGSSQREYVDFILEYYADLDRYFELMSDEIRRQALRNRVLELVRPLGGRKND